MIHEPVGRTLLSLRRLLRLRLPEIVASGLGLRFLLFIVDRTGGVALLASHAHHPTHSLVGVALREFGAVACVFVASPVESLAHDGTQAFTVGWAYPERNVVSTWLCVVDDVGQTTELAPEHGDELDLERWLELELGLI